MSLTQKTILISLFVLLISAGVIFKNYKILKAEEKRAKQKPEFLNNIQKDNNQRILRIMLFSIPLIASSYILIGLLIFRLTTPEHLKKREYVSIGYGTRNNVKYIKDVGDIPISAMTLGMPYKDLQNYSKTEDSNFFVDIVELNLSNHYFKKIPDEVWKMKDLHTLHLRNNNIKYVDAIQLRQLPNLKIIDLSNNPIPEHYINELRAKSNLRVIYEKEKINHHERSNTLIRHKLNEIKYGIKKFFSEG